MEPEVLRKLCEQRIGEAEPYSLWGRECFLAKSYKQVKELVIAAAEI